MSEFIKTLVSLGSTDAERAAQLNGVQPQEVYRWRTGKTTPRADVLLRNPALAEAIAADARAGAVEVAEAA